MKKLVIATILGICSNFAHSQSENWCGTDAYNETIFEANPELKTQMHEHLIRTTSGMYLSESREDEYIIPVVVHVLHDNGEGNISFEQIQSGIDMLNEDFNRENSDADATRNTADAPFEPVASDVGIRFELAKIDPNGDCTNGVQRRFVGSASYNADNAAKHYATGGLDAWDRNYYFNIWVVNSIESGGGGTTLGYAEFPYSGGSSNYGVIIRNDAYGTVGTGSDERTLTHEVGHCLGLFHTFQGGCHTANCSSTGDFCCDTPPVSEAQWSCSPLQNTCDEIPTGDFYDFDVSDQFENFMSYSPCQNMFSSDQKTIMLSNLESIGFLSNLVDVDHYDETGVGMPAVLCAADFMSDYPVICAGDQLQYYDVSYSNVIDRTWTFEGGTPATTNEENPVITYETPGIYPVTLEATDGLTTVSTTTADYIIVLPNPGDELPYIEGFENLTELPDNNRFLVLNDDSDDTWELTATASYSGDFSVYLPNRGNDNRTKDELISGSIDLSEVDPDDAIVFNFKLAYRKRFTSNDEVLQFYISKDCGETWALRKNIDNDDLGEIVQNSAYFPEDASEWKQINITNILPDYYVSDFRFKFVFQNDNGNNIFIDNINMYAASTAGLSNETNLRSVSIYPNPAQNYAQLTLNANQSEVYHISLINTVGEEISVINNAVLPIGESNFDISTDQLANGLYFIKIKTETGAQFVKLIKG